jgi:GTP-binding protein EngB required for normal cell division
MPGYGFAKAPKDISKKWRHLINDYLRGRQALKRRWCWWTAGMASRTSTAI